MSGAGVNGPEMISEALIYIADDEPANRLLLERILARGGYTRVVSFPDGKSLLTACEAEEPDLVLADLRMPGVDGFGVLESLRRESADGYLPVVILTAEPNRDARKRALSLGAADFLGKPFDFDEVLLRSRNLIETRLLHAALATRIVSLGDEVEARGREIVDVASERAAIAASLDRASAFDTPESIAAALCGDLATAIDVRHVTLLIFEASDRAVSFVAHNARSSADVGYALPADRSLELWQRASVGAWVEEIVARPGAAPTVSVSRHPVGAAPSMPPCAVAVASSGSFRPGPPMSVPQNGWRATSRAWSTTQPSAARSWDERSPCDNRPPMSATRWRGSSPSGHFARSSSRSSRSAARESWATRP